MMLEPVVFVLLLVAVAVGFLVGRLSGRRKPGGSEANQKWLRQSYFRGLNHLLNEEPDAAIDTFVSTLEVNSETLETHFALGSLLRRRGEVDRAIRVHQNLLARPSLTLNQQQQAQVELALDYMRSGLLDRAEVLFKELLDSKDLAIRGTALERLVEIYRDEREWENAIAMAELLCHKKMARNVRYWRELQAHFSCELADDAVQNKNMPAAQDWVQRAVGYDRESIRARLALARISMSQQQWDGAIKVLEKISADSPLYISEGLPLLRTCYSQQGGLGVFARRLEELYRKSPCEMLLQQLAEVLAEVEGESVARALLERELGRFPALTPLARVLGVFEQQAGCRVDYHQFSPILDQALAERAVYECRHCGFIGQQLHWCCPGCKHWSTMTSRLATGNLA